MSINVQETILVLDPSLITGVWKDNETRHTILHFWPLDTLKILKFDNLKPHTT